MKEAVAVACTWAIAVVVAATLVLPAGLLRVKTTTPTTPATTSRSTNPASTMFLGDNSREAAPLLLAGRNAAREQACSEGMDSVWNRMESANKGSKPQQSDRPSWDL